MPSPDLPPRSGAGDQLLVLLQASPGAGVCQPCAIARLRSTEDHVRKAIRELILHGLGRGEWTDCALCRKVTIVLRIRERRPAGDAAPPG